MSSRASRTREFFENAGELGIFSFQVVRAAFRPPLEIREISRQITEIGWDSVPLILAWGVAVGIVMAQLIWSSLVSFGAVETVIPAGLSRGHVSRDGTAYDRPSHGGPRGGGHWR